MIIITCRSCVFFFIFFSLGRLSQPSLSSRASSAHTHTLTRVGVILLYLSLMSAEAPARKKKCSMMGPPRWRGRSRIDAGADTGRPTGADRGRAAGRAPGARVLRHTGPGRTHCLQTTYAHVTRSIGDASRTSRITNFFLSSRTKYI